MSNVVILADSSGMEPPRPEPPSEPPSPEVPPPSRLTSLDVFRGATVASMIFVNGPGDWGHLYPPFAHAEWHGWTPTDLVFPFFLFIVGVAGALSLQSRIARGATKGDLIKHAAIRGMTIVLVGWAMVWYPFGLERLARLRIPGVLPRIGLVFFLGTALVVLAGRRAAVVIAIAAALVALHTFLLTGLGYDLTREGNIQRAVDLFLLKGHLWKPDWDPEGIVSTLTATATMLTGSLVGFFVVRRRDRPGSLVTPLLLAGLVSAALGLVWSRTLPINKNLWTGSYVLLSSGLATALLALSILLVDVMRRRATPGPRGAFFLPFGRNPLLAFVLSGLLAKTLGLVKVASGGKTISLGQLIYRTGFSWIADPTLRSHAYALAFVLFWYAVLRVFDRRGWYWTV